MICRPKRSRPRSASRGSSSTATTRHPRGHRRASRALTRGPVVAQPRNDASPASPTPEGDSNTVSAKQALLICELGLALHKEAGTADELAGLLGEHPKGAFAAVLGVGGLLFFVLLVICDDEAFFQDHVETGLDIIVVELVLILVVGLDRHDVAFDDDTHSPDDDVVVIILIVEIVDQGDIAQVVVIVVEQIRIGQIFEVRLVRVGNLEIVNLYGLFEILTFP